MLKRTHILLAVFGLLLVPLTLCAAPKARHTAVKQTAAAGDKFTFVAYGDTRTNPVEHAVIINEILTLHPEFVLQSGDLVSDGKNPAQWDQFTQITKPLHDAHIAYYPARGNHDVGAYYPHRVTYHASCHGLRSLGLGDGPESLLRAVRGIDLVKLEDVERCCGFGGTFAVKNAGVSSALLAEKTNAILNTQAEACTACDNSCLMHLAGALHRQQTGVKTVHLAQILASVEGGR